jgi:hypothetical protein
VTSFEPCKTSDPQIPNLNCFCLHVKLILYSAVSHDMITYKMKCTTFVPSGFLRFENGGKGLKVTVAFGICIISLVCRPST